LFYIGEIYMTTVKYKSNFIIFLKETHRIKIFCLPNCTHVTDG